MKDFIIFGILLLILFMLMTKSDSKYGYNKYGYRKYGYNKNKTEGGGSCGAHKKEDEEDEDEDKY